VVTKTTTTVTAVHEKKRKAPEAVAVVATKQTATKKVAVAAIPNGVSETPVKKAKRPYVRKIKPPPPPPEENDEAEEDEPPIPTQAQQQQLNEFMCSDDEGGLATPHSEGEDDDVPCFDPAPSSPSAVSSSMLYMYTQLPVIYDIFLQWAVGRNDIA